jgi:hypothetical protein
MGTMHISYHGGCWQVVSMAMMGKKFGWQQNVTIGTPRGKEPDHRPCKYCQVLRMSPVLPFNPARSVFVHADITILGWQATQVQHCGGWT